MMPRLLGITRDNIMRLDAETKEVINIWPLITLRRWAAAPNSFTMDFGDYADSYYSVQTPDGEQISQLIAGYIDIILKRRKKAMRTTDDDSVEVAVAEDTMRPAKATAVNVFTSRSGVATEVNVAAAAVYEHEKDVAGARQVITSKRTAKQVDYSAAERRVSIMPPNLQTAMRQLYGANEVINHIQQEIDKPVEESGALFTSEMITNGFRCRLL